MARRGDARAERPPSPQRGAPFRGSWFSTWAGDNTRPAREQTVLKSRAVWGDTINGIDVRHPILTFRDLASPLHYPALGLPAASERTIQLHQGLKLAKLRLRERELRREES